MAFFFGGRKKETESKQITKEEEEAKYLRIHLHQLAEENETLKQQLEDQKETAYQNKKLLGTITSSLITINRRIHWRHYNSRGSCSKVQLYNQCARRQS